MRKLSLNELHVSKEKVTQYLLNPKHPDGGSKARFFKKAGFKIEEWQGFADAVRLQAAGQAAKTMIETPYGTKYVVDGVMETPEGKEVPVRTVWISRFRDKKIELITVYPL